MRTGLEFDPEPQRAARAASTGETHEACGRTATGATRRGSASRRLDGRRGGRARGVTGLKRCRKLQALTPGSAVSETTVRGRLRMFVFDSRVSENSDQLAERTRTATDDLCGCTGRAAISPDPSVCSVNSITSITQAGPFTTTPGRSESPVARGKGDTDDSCRDSGAYL
jgi:hypothetical protein